nr:cystatin-9-like [Cavia porcellus]
MPLLLLCVQPQGAHTWCSEEDLSSYHQLISNPELPAAIQLAQDTFNQLSLENRAYRLERILSTQRELVGNVLCCLLPVPGAWGKGPGRAFSMQLLFRRTVCRKSEKSINICPFHEGPEPSNTFTCSFTILSQHQAVQLSILKKTCSKGPPSQ